MGDAVSEIAWFGADLKTVYLDYRGTRYNRKIYICEKEQNLWRFAILDDTIVHVLLLKRI